MSIGSRIKELRIKRGITQEELAQQIGVTKGAIGNYENEVSSPKIELMYKLFEALDCDANYLHQDDMKNSIYRDTATPEEFEKLVKPYRSLDPHGQQTVDIILDREAERVKQLLDTQGQLRQSQSQVDSLKLQLSHERTVSRFFAYYGRVAAAGTSVEFSDIAAGVRAYPENEINKQADYVIGVNGDSMEPEYFDGDVVYVQKTDHIEIGDVGIFQRGNSIYIKKVGENGLISLNPDYPPLMADGDRIVVLGKVLGKAEEI